jgi:hypothetical protein
MSAAMREPLRLLVLRPAPRLELATHPALAPVRWPVRALVPALPVPECLRPALWPALRQASAPLAPMHSDLVSEWWLFAPEQPLTPSAEGRKL